MDWIEDKTGHSNAYWVARIQHLISIHSTPPDDTGHGSTDTECVLKELIHEIVSHSPHVAPGVVPYDENMYAFSVLSYVASLWYGRVQLAKISDPNRPVGNGMIAYKNRYLPWLIGMQLILADQSNDSTYFPGQKWQNPFTPDATDGDFV